MRSRIGMVFQEYNLVERLTVMENLLTGVLGKTPAWKAWLRKFDQADIQRAWEMLDLAVGPAHGGEAMAIVQQAGQMRIDARLVVTLVLAVSAVIR